MYQLSPVAEVEGLRIEAGGPEMEVGDPGKPTHAHNTSSYTVIGQTRGKLQVM